MKFQTAVMITGASAWMWSASAVSESISSAEMREESKPLASLIAELADADYQTREAASRKIWGLGDSALDELKLAAAGKDPEQAYRARDLIRKIQLFITPDTDSEVIDLMERYGKASANERANLLDQMKGKRAWRQILKLYASDKNALIMGQHQEDMEVTAVNAARECLMEGNVAGAREFLEMGPSTPSGLLSLAEFHRCQGTMEAELKRAKSQKGKAGAAWRLALYRAVGDLDAARQAADETGEAGIFAALSTLLGDPLPWLGLVANDGGVTNNQRIYADLAAKRWGKNQLNPEDLKELMRLVSSKNSSERSGAASALLALGERRPAEQWVTETLPLEAFTYFETLERLPEAFKSLGLDPGKPDFTTWVRGRFDKMLTQEIDEEEDGAKVSSQEELLLLAMFLEQRGLHDACETAFSMPMMQLAAKNEEAFLEMLGSFFSGTTNTNSNTKISAAPAWFSRNLAIKWAGENEDRWDKVVSSVFGKSELMTGLWEWLAVLDPKSTRSDQLDGLIALTMTGPDSGKLRARWLDLAWKSFHVLAPGKRDQALQKIQFITTLGGDAKNGIRVWELLPPATRVNVSLHVQNLTAVGRWEEAVKLNLKSIADISTSKLDPSPWLHASAAACLRRMGREKEALEQDIWAETLALGRDGIGIGYAYALAGDFERAQKWWARAASQTSPYSEDFVNALELHGDALLHEGQWAKSAAISEVMSYLYSQVVLMNRVSQSLVTLRKYRFQSDMAKALVDLKTDRAGAIGRLEDCHRLYATDSGIADYFYPALRSVGLLKEHDAWFASNWERMMTQLVTYPDADNSANSAGWLASRAQRKLNEAETLLKKSLAIRPEQSAYLDTMAEIQFARGKREKALEWSDRAVNSTPQDLMLRRQNKRFRIGKLPR